MGVVNRAVFTMIVSVLGGCARVQTLPSSDPSPVPIECRGDSDPVVSKNFPEFFKTAREQLIRCMRECGVWHRFDTSRLPDAVYFAIVKAELSSSGSVRKATLFRSSGYAETDQISLAAVQESGFSPPPRDLLLERPAGEPTIAFAVCLDLR